MGFSLDRPFSDESTAHPFFNVLGKPFPRFINGVSGA
jgi:hypothetical protein